MIDSACLIYQFLYQNCVYKCFMEIPCVWSVLIFITDNGIGAYVSTVSDQEKGRVWFSGSDYTYFMYKFLHRNNVYHGHTRQESITRGKFIHDSLSLATGNVIGTHTRVVEQERGRIGHLESILHISYTNSYVVIVKERPTHDQH